MTRAEEIAIDRIPQTADACLYDPAKLRATFAAALESYAKERISPEDVILLALPLETIGNEIRASEKAHPQMSIELQAAVLHAQDRIRVIAARIREGGEE